MESRRKPCVARLDLQCQCGLCDRLWFLASHLIKPIWWRLERSLLNTKCTYRKGCLGVSTESCQPLLIIIRVPEFLSENGAEPWGHSHPKQCTVQFSAESPLLVLWSSLSLPFPICLFLTFFLSHSSAAFLSSSSIPVLPLCPLNQTETSPPSLRWGGSSSKIGVNAVFP